MVYAELLLLAVCLPPCPAQAATLVTGMNIANPMRANEASRTALIGPLLRACIWFIAASTDDPTWIASQSALCGGRKNRPDCKPPIRPGGPSVPYRPAEYPSSGAAILDPPPTLRCCKHNECTYSFPRIALSAGGPCVRSKPSVSWMR